MMCRRFIAVISILLVGELWQLSKGQISLKKVKNEEFSAKMDDFVSGDPSLLKQVEKSALWNQMLQDETKQVMLPHSSGFAPETVSSFSGKADGDFPSFSGKADDDFDNSQQAHMTGILSPFPDEESMTSAEARPKNIDGRLMSHTGDALRGDLEIGLSLTHNHPERPETVPSTMLNGDKEENELPGKGQLNDDIELVEKPDDEQSNAYMQSNAFAHSVADGDAMEQLMRMIDAQVDDGREDVPVGFSVDDPRATGEISWSTPEIFDIPLVIDANTKLGDELLSVKAYDAINDQLEFICYRPELVFCLTDFISSGNYQLRVVYSSEQKPIDFELPIAIIVRHSLSDSSPIESIYENRNFTIRFVVSDEVIAHEQYSTTEVVVDHSSLSSSNFATILTAATTASDSPTTTTLTMNHGTTDTQAVNNASYITERLQTKPDIVSLSTTPLSITESEASSSMIAASELLLSTTRVDASISSKIASSESSTTIDELDAFARVTPLHTTQRTTVANLIVSSNQNMSEIGGAMFEFMPHFEHETYDIFVPEGKNQNATFIALIYFVGRAGTAAPSFEIMFDRLKWFELGDINTEQYSNRLVSALKIMLRAGADININKTKSGFYKFSIKAKQAEFITTTNLKVEIMSFTVKLTTITTTTTTNTIASASVNASLTSSPESTTVTLPMMSSTLFDTSINNMDVLLRDDTSLPTIVTSVNDFDSLSTEGTFSSKESPTRTSTMKVTTTSLATERTPLSVTISNGQEPPIPLVTTSVISTIVNHQADETEVHSTLAPDENISAENIHDEKGESQIVTPNILDEMGPNKSDAMVLELEQSSERRSKITDEFVVNTVQPSSTKSTVEVHQRKEPTNTENAQTDIQKDNEDSSAVANDETTENPTDQAAIARSSDVSSIIEMTNEQITFSSTISSSIATAENDDLMERTTEATHSTEMVSREMHNEMETTKTIASNETPKEMELITFSEPVTEAIVYATELQMDFKMARRGGLVVSENLHEGDIIADFEIIVTAKDMDPHDVIMLSVNSTAFDVIPRRMQPGKTVFLSVKDSIQLDYEMPPNSFIVEITAWMRSRSSISISKNVMIIKEDASDNAPRFLSDGYDFHVSESSITGQKVGQMEVEDADERDRGQLTFRLIGPGSELFAVSGGTISVACPTALPCLDREETDAYHLLAVATDRGGLNSAPASLRIFIADRNDNGPTIHLTRNEIRISDGKFVRPFAVKVRDADISPFNVNDISSGGNASTFISLERIRNDLYVARLSSLPIAGNYQLEIIARDPTGINIPSMAIVDVYVLNTITKAHFKRARYERTINSEKLHKGNPLVQPEFEGASVESIRFITLRNDPGWLMIDEYSGNLFVGDVPSDGVTSGKYDISIAAVNRTSGRVLAETIFSLTVLSGSRMITVFQQKLFTKVFRKDPALMHVSMSILSPDDKSSVMIVRESILAIDEKLHKVSIDKSAISFASGNAILEVKKLQNVRSIEFRMAATENPNDTALVVVYLSSDPEEVAARNRELSRPKFIHPWRTDLNIITIKLAEETPEGYTVLSLPAYNPLTGERIKDVQLSGDMAPFFTVDGETGDVKVLHPLDYETIEPQKRKFDMLLTAGEEPYEAVARLRVELLDMDDNPPKMETLGIADLNNLTVAENSRPGTVLFELHISDADYLNGKRDVFKYTLSGEGSANFQVKEVNDTVAVIVSPAADLDHEKAKTLFISLKVEDSGGNSDSAAAVVTIIDINDNAPIFVPRQYKSEAVENWPIGTVLTMVYAEDRDDEDNGRVEYSFTANDGHYFEVDKDSGLVRTARPLIGLARAQPYELIVTATDKGVPALSATAIISVRIVESTSLSRPGDDKEIHIFEPPVDFILNLDENIPANQRVYTVQARIGGFNDQFEREVKYSITAVDNVTDGGWFGIDSSSGDVFTLQQLDYEQQSAITLRVTAQNALLPEKIASRLLRIRINDLDDNQPSFGEIDGSVHRVFSISETGEGTTEMMATLHADDADDPPYDSVYYYLLPTCSNRDGKFTIDKETGVITVTDYTLLQNDEYHLCAFASAYDLPAPPEIAFDNKNDSMIAFTVEVKSLKMAETLKGLPKIKFNNNTIITFGEEIYTPIPIRIDVNDELSPIKYHLNSVTFIPSESSSASTEKLDYFAVDPSSGDVRIDPALADHAEGVFSLHIDAMQKSTRTSIADLITSVHNVKSSSMLKFIFDQEANLLSLNLDDFKTRLNSALNIDSSIAQISVVIGMPHSHSDSFKNRSSVCFHALRGDVILSQESAILALSATLNGDSTLSRLYQAFKVANIEPCSELERTLSSGIVVSRVTLFWVGVALLGLLILISFCLYSCFIVRYKDCLDEKKAAMNGSEAHSLPQKKPCPSVQFYSIQHLAVTDY